MQNLIFDHFRLFEIFEVIEENNNNNNNDKDNNINKKDEDDDILKTREREDLGFKVVIDGTTKIRNDEKLIPTKAITIKNKVFKVQRNPLEVDTISFMFQLSSENAKQIRDDDDDNSSSHSYNSEYDDEGDGDGSDYDDESTTWIIFSWGKNGNIQEKSDIMLNKHKSPIKIKPSNNPTTILHSDNANNISPSKDDTSHKIDKTSFSSNNSKEFNKDKSEDSNSGDKDNGGGYSGIEDSNIYSSVRLELMYASSGYKLLAYGNHLLDKHVRFHFYF